MTGVYDPPQATLSVLIAIIRFLRSSRSRRTGDSGERSHTADLADRRKHRDGHRHLGDALHRMLAFHFPQEPESRPPAAYDKPCRDISLVFKLTVENGQTSSPPIY
jgi:hypothetical protein